MHDDDVWADDMSHLLGWLTRAPDDAPQDRTDEAQLDALLDGASIAAPDWQPVADLLSASAASAQGAELAGEQAVLSAFGREQAAAMAGRGASSRQRVGAVSALVRRRPRVARRVAACFAAGAVSFTGLATAAYACVLPAPIQSFAHHTIAAPAPATPSPDANVTTGGPSGASSPANSRVAVGAHPSASAAGRPHTPTLVAPSLSAVPYLLPSPTCTRMGGVAWCVVCPTAPTPKSDAAGDNGPRPFVCRFPFPGHGFGLSHAPGHGGQPHQAPQPTDKTQPHPKGSANVMHPAPSLPTKPTSGPVGQPSVTPNTGGKGGGAGARPTDEPTAHPAPSSDPGPRNPPSP